MASRLASAWRMRAFSRSTSIPTITGISSFTNRRKSRATWSFRLRAVCSRLPVAPMRSVSSTSMFMWMSSLSLVNSTLPSSISARRIFKVSTILSASSLAMMPCSPSMVAWAMEPVMSCLYRRASKEMEELKSLTLSSVSFWNRPAHSFIVVASFPYKQRRAGAEIRLLPDAQNLTAFHFRRSGITECNYFLFSSPFARSA